jgi:hypothetical protein
MSTENDLGRDCGLNRRRMECFAGLGARVIEFAGLPDYDRARPDDHDLFYIFTLRHLSRPLT